MTRPVLCLAALAVVACPAVAHGARPATPDETTAISRALDQPVSCLRATVTTARDADAGYARVTFLQGAGCPVGNGFVTLSTAGASAGTWNVGFADAEGTGPCEDFDVPPGVGRDLEICDPKPRRTLFPDFARERLTFKPTTLPQGAHGYYRSIRWSSWSRTRARGLGVFDYVDHYTRFRVPVRIVLYRAVVCDTGDRVFTRRKVTAVRSGDRQRIRFDTRFRSTAGCRVANDL